MNILLAETEAQSTLTEQQRQSLFSQGIQLKHLSYTYPEQHKPTLVDINLHIKPGEKVAVLGKVGSGKSTLVNCLNRYLDVAPGQIFIDGRDISDFSRSDLRSAVRTVSQQPFLFSDTIEQNIRFGAAESDAALTIEEALYQSAMLDEVRQFPAAEQTLVGEKGILLSGGQKQRLSLARAMYTPCKLVVLDNVLSAVDNQTERFLLSRIFDDMRSQASLIVSHRPAVMERVDRIILLDQGRIVAEGSHRQLLASSDIYRATWEVLQQGLDGDAEASD